MNILRRRASTLRYFHSFGGSKGRIEGLTVRPGRRHRLHSRVRARSNIHGLLKLGAKVIVCGPSTLGAADDRAAARRRGLPIIWTKCLHALRRGERVADSSSERQRMWTVPIDPGVFPPVRRGRGAAPAGENPDILLLVAGTDQPRRGTDAGGGRRAAQRDPGAGDEWAGGAHGGAASAVRAAGGGRIVHETHERKRGSSFIFFSCFSCVSWGFAPKFHEVARQRR